MSAYSDWKAGLITDMEYSYISRREEYEDQMYDEWNEEEEFEDGDFDEF